MHIYVYIYIYYLRSLKFTLKHLKRYYMFRSHDHSQGASVAYPGILFGVGGDQQIQLKTEDRENGDLGAVVP